MIKPLFVVFLLLVARPAAALDWQHAFYVTSQGFVIVGHVTDTATTQRAIGEGTGHETNPWLLHFDNPVAFGVSKAAVGAGGLWLTDRIENKWIAGAMNYAVGGLFLGIAMHNYGVTHK
jgi:hypothetical protein